MKDHPAVRKYGHSFARSTGMETEDALQEARLAFVRAERAVDDGRYDPRLASFNTFATHCVYRAMCSEASRRRGRNDPTEELSDEIPDGVTPSPDRRLVLAELVRELPADARACVELVLGSVEVEASARAVRQYARRVLGMSKSRVDASFSAVAEMLASI